tara:strand:+ start:1983 stop:2192 length:210 start_codon:yes stop_codon:yes gene_type:complete
MPSQEDQIYLHLKKYGKIDAMEALKKYNCFRLSARIFDLKQQNINIETDHVTLKNGKRVAQYKLIKEAK